MTIRGAAALLVATLIASGLWGVISRASSAWGSGRPVSADELLVAVAAAAALGGVAWLGLGLLLGLLARVPGSLGRVALALTEVVTPRVLRQAAALVLGVGVAAGLAPGAAVAAPLRPAVAASATTATTASTATTATTATTEPDAVVTHLPDPGFRSLPDPRWVPAPPTVRPQPEVSVLSPPPNSAATAAAEVVVQRGDSLWTIVARFLGPGASDAEIASAWPGWYEANRDVIGADPDLVLPGQVLRAPQVSIP